MHLLQNGQTCVPQTAWLDPELRQFLPALSRMARRVVDSGYEVLKEQDAAEEQALTWLSSQPRVMFLDVYKLPFLSAEYCDLLVAEANAMSDTIGHEPNQEEEVAYQIPELFLETACPSLFAALAVLKERVLDVYSVLLYANQAPVIRAIQFARYESGGVEHGNWHHDDDSDLTAVVSLNPEKFSGGGTDIRINAWSYHTIAPLDKGNVLLFNGKHRLHRGRQVHTGVRDLLVFWNERK